MSSFKSIVNDVSRARYGGRDSVVKTFANSAWGTGIDIPIERIDVEERVLEILRTLPSPDIKTPSLYGRRQNSLFIEYLKGDVLSSLTISQLIEISSDIYRLGMWLRTVETELYKFRNMIFKQRWATQEKISRVLKLLKGAPGRRMDKEDVVSLGDVGLSNLIRTADGIAAIDFEFSHLATAGRDIGQFSAQLEYRFGIPRLSKAAMAGYVAAGGAGAGGRAWKEAFRQYYCRSRRSNE